MKLQTKLFFSSTVTGMLMLLFVGVVIFFSFQLRKSYDQQQLAQKITETSFQMTLFRSDYVLHPSDRPKTQWVDAYQALSRTLDEVSPLFSNPEAKTLLQDAHTASLDSRALFGLLIHNIEEGGSLAVREELNNQLTVKAEACVSDALRLAALSRADANSLLRLFEFIVVSLGLLFTLIYSISYFIVRSVITSIRKLGDNLTKISALDFASAHVAVTSMKESNDEIGLLTKAFHEMVVKLQVSYATLGEKVLQRTAQLAATAQEAEAAKKAILNVLQDLNMAKNEIEEKLRETERLNKAMVDRELKMIELKKEISRLKRPPRS